MHSAIGNLIRDVIIYSHSYSISHDELDAVISLMITKLINTLRLFKPKCV